MALFPITIKEIDRDGISRIRLTGTANAKLYAIRFVNRIIISLEELDIFSEATNPAVLYVERKEMLERLDKIRKLLETHQEKDYNYLTYKNKLDL